MDEPKSGLVKRPDAGRFGGYTYLARSKASQAIADDILFEADAVSGSFSLTVSPALLAITGQSVNLRVSRQLTVTPSSVSITGRTVNLTVGRRVAASPATVAISGQSVSVKASRQLTVTPATVAIAGQSVGLVAGRRLSVSPAIVAVTGQSAGLTADRKLTVTPATVQIVGQSVNLTYSPATASYTLTVTPATVAITGQAANLTYTGNQESVSTSARFFGLPGPPIDRKKEQEEEPFPVVTIDQIAPQISALMEVHEGHSARRAAAQARESAARINRAIALRRTHDAALFMAAQKVALVQEIDRLIAEEVRRVEIEMDDEEVLLLAA